LNETERCERVVALSRGVAFSMAGATNVGELIALLSMCDGFAGNDSGAMHLASALGIPTVGIFGSTNPARTGPFGPRSSVVSHPLDCTPCLARTCRFGHYQCLLGIAPVEVAAELAAQGALG
jgi:heptosyltransferase-2